jgi:hypothetical protein
MKAFKTSVILLVEAALVLVSSAQTASPALQSYQELLKSKDKDVTRATYACFYDDEQKNKQFFLITALLLATTEMTLTVEDFNEGIGSDRIAIFDGHPGPASSADGLFVKLTTMISNPVPSHETDSVSWTPSNVVVKKGFGTLDQGQLRITDEFQMQRSTGRFTEDTVWHFPDKLSTTHDTGRCIRVPGSKLPEDDWKLMEEAEKAGKGK